MKINILKGIPRNFLCFTSTLKILSVWVSTQIPDENDAVCGELILVKGEFMRAPYFILQVGAYANIKVSTFKKNKQMLTYFSFLSPVSILGPFFFFLKG